MIVVADTSPLNYLVLLRKPEILPEIYGRVVVPNAVVIELRHLDAPRLVREWAMTPPSWLEIVQVGTIDSTLAKELGAESEKPLA
jgi:predicted nucleic acid-binding protein